MQHQVAQVVSSMGERGVCTDPKIMQGPTSTSNWIFKDLILCGDYPRGAKLAKLVSSGVTHFVDLRAEGSDNYLLTAQREGDQSLQYTSFDMQRHVASVHFSDITNTALMLKSVLAQCILTRSVAYIHCSDGHSLTAVAMCGLLSFVYGCSGLKGSQIAAQLHGTRQNNEGVHHLIAPNQRAFVKDLGQDTNPFPLSAYGSSGGNSPGGHSPTVPGVAGGRGIPQPMETSAFTQAGNHQQGRRGSNGNDPTPSKHFSPGHSGRFENTKGSGGGFTSINIFGASGNEESPPKRTGRGAVQGMTPEYPHHNTSGNNTPHRQQQQQGGGNGGNGQHSYVDPMGRLEQAGGGGGGHQNQGAGHFQNFDQQQQQQQQQQQSSLFPVPGNNGGGGGGGLPPRSRSSSQTDLAHQQQQQQQQQGGSNTSSVSPNAQRNTSAFHGQQDNHVQSQYEEDNIPPESPWTPLGSNPQQGSVLVAGGGNGGGNMAHSDSQDPQLPPHMVPSPIDYKKEPECARGPSCNTNWIVKDQVLIGPCPHPDHKDFRYLVQQRFDTFVVLTEENEALKYVPVYEQRARVRCDALHFPMPDGHPVTGNQTQPFLNFVAELVERVRVGEKMYIHCRQGHGRAGLISAGLLAELYGLTGMQAVNLNSGLHACRVDTEGRESPDNQEQRLCIISLFKN